MKIRNHVLKTLSCNLIKMYLWKIYHSTEKWYYLQVALSLSRFFSLSLILCFTCDFPPEFWLCLFRSYFLAFHLYICFLFFCSKSFDNFCIVQRGGDIVLLSAEEDLFLTVKNLCLFLTFVRSTTTFAKNAKFFTLQFYFQKKGESKR